MDKKLNSFSNIEILFWEVHSINNSNIDLSIFLQVKPNFYIDGL